MKKSLLVMLFLLIPALSYALTVTAPTLNEQIPAGSAYSSIQWTATAGVTRFNVYASYDNGLSWSQLNTAGKLDRVNAFVWSVPLKPKNKATCIIKVIGYNDAGTKLETGKSSIFAIDVLNLTFPNAMTDSLDAGLIRTITWNTATSAVLTRTKLSYTIDGGLTWLPIATITGNPGSYDWTVPQMTATAKIKVDLLNNTTLVATDTSGAFPIKATSKTNADAIGTYYMPYMDYDYFSLPGVLGTHIFALDIDGAGLFDHSTIVSSQNPGPEGVTNVPYTISPDGQVKAGGARGLISGDNSMILLAETNKTEKILGGGLAIKSTPGLTNAVLNGTYILGQGGADFAAGGWVGLLTATFDGNGNGNIHCDDMTGGCQFIDIPVTYSVDSLTGRVVDSLGQQGMVTADGNVFTLVDYDDADNIISLLVGIKAPSVTLSNATMAGKFIAATFGISETHGPWTDIFQLKLNGAGGGTATELYTSWPPLSPAQPVTYSVGADGSLNIGTIQGIVMGNGQGFLVVDNSAGEVSLTIGLKKAK